MFQKIKDFLFKPKSYQLFKSVWLGLIAIALFIVIVALIISEILVVGLLKSLIEVISYIVISAILTTIVCLVVYGIPFLMQIITNITINTFNFIKNQFKGE